MKLISRIYIGALTGVLVLIGGLNVGAQEVTGSLVQDLKKEIVQGIPKEFIQEIKKQFVEEFKKELVAELRKELAQAGKTPVEEAAMKMAKEAPVRINSNVLTAAMTALNGSGSGEARAMLATLVRQFKHTDRSPGSPGPVDTPRESPQLNVDLIAVVTNNSNPVATLSVDQIRKLYTGEYNNWNQVGGPNLPVKVIVWGDSVAGLERLMKSQTNPDATKLGYLSLMIPAVDRSKGAVGFLPARNMEQLQFVADHRALRKVAIKNDTDSPAVAPSLQALKEGTYPMMGDPSVRVGRTAHLQEATR